MGATPKQIEFVQKLIDERDVPDAIVSDIWSVCRDPKATPREHVSPLIDGLLKMPKKVAVIGASAVSVTGGTPLATLPLGRYAIDMREAVGVMTDKCPVSTGNDLMFVRVAEYRGTRYLRVLEGAPGAFHQHKVARADAIALAGVVARDPQAAGKRFSEEYTCCARCLSELTDQTSRATGYGPDCRKAMGL